jgi:hypothetical protein
MVTGVRVLSYKIYSDEGLKLGGIRLIFFLFKMNIFLYSSF